MLPLSRSPFVAHFPSSFVPVSLLSASLRRALPRLPVIDPQLLPSTRTIRVSLALSASPSRLVLQTLCPSRFQPLSHSVPLVHFFFSSDLSLSSLASCPFKLAFFNPCSRGNVSLFLGLPVEPDVEPSRRNFFPRRIGRIHRLPNSVPVLTIGGP